MLSLLSLAAGAVSALPLQRHPAERSAVLELWDQGAALDSYTTADGRRFGRGLLPLFMLQQPGFTNLNHGSFGTMPHTVFAQQIAYIRTMESRPDDWFRVSCAQRRLDKKGLPLQTTQSMRCAKAAANACCCAGSCFC